MTGNTHTSRFDAQMGLCKVILKIFFIPAVLVFLFKAFCAGNRQRAWRVVWYIAPWNWVTLPWVGRKGEYCTSSWVTSYAGESAKVLSFCRKKIILYVNHSLLNYSWRERRTDNGTAKTPKSFLRQRDKMSIGKSWAEVWTNREAKVVYLVE